MSAIIGPNIVHDNLILYLDASNPKSFRGEPTINTLSTWMDGTFTNWSSWADGGGAGTNQLLPDYPYGYKVQFTNSGNTGRYALSTYDYGNTPVKRTFSIYI